MRPTTRTVVLLAMLAASSFPQCVRAGRAAVRMMSATVSTPTPGSRGEVGFLGLGIMGAPMAQNLVASGRSIVVWNRSEGKSKELAAVLNNNAEEPLVTVAASPKEVVERCGLTYAMLSTLDATDAVFRRGPGAALEGACAGKSIVNMATLTPQYMRELADEVEAKGASYLEGPVSGSKVQAEQGQLVFLAGGDQALFEDPQVQLDLDAMGKASFYFGDVGSGTKTKLIVNMIMGVMMQGLSEGVGLAKDIGIPPGKLVEVLTHAAIANPMFGLKGPKIVADDHAPNFPLKHCTKDMNFALQLCDELGLSPQDALPVASAATDEFVRALAAGYGDDDFSAVAKLRFPERE